MSTNPKTAIAMSAAHPRAAAATADIAELEQIARHLRRRIVEFSSRTKTPHLASCLSCVDILVAYYFSVLRVDPADPKDHARDRFILSKGHAAPALFQTLALAGFYPESMLDEVDHHKGGGVFGEHPPAPGHLPGIEAATGSLGHGLPIGVGIALAGRLRGLDYHVDVLVGDGECNEGSIWEAAMLAAGQNLENLTAVVDYNKWQATGRSQDIMALDPLADKWRAFGWETFEIDGHDIAAVVELLMQSRTGRPRAVIAHTIKGKGVSFMEDDNNWHYRTPDTEEVAAARRELGFLE